jgi:hypothetical protein
VFSKDLQNEVMRLRALYLEKLEKKAREEKKEK